MVVVLAEVVRQEGKEEEQTKQEVEEMNQVEMMK